MNWSLILSAVAYGVLFALYAGVSGIAVLGGMPDAWGWMKLAASGVGGFVLGVFTYMRDPNAAWRSPPGAVKQVILALAIVPLLAACAVPFGAGDLTSAQLREWAKIKDASVVCVRGVYAGALVNVLSINADKGVPVGATVKEDCSAVFVSPPEKSLPSQ